MTLLSTLRNKGLIQDITDEKAIEALPKGTGFYFGMDPTARSLHIGNLVGLMIAMHFGRAGFSPYILFGGATGAIGDPSGRTSERTLLARSEVEENATRMRRKVEEIFNRAGVEARFVDNYEWTRDLTILDFLRDVGKHFTVNYMSAKEVVKARLEEGISFTEFSYMLLQANDFFHLYRTAGCKLQFGGSDQWGNITAGLELIRRRGYDDAEAFSFPLILDSQGRKLGKSFGNAPWLDQELLSPYRFHQFWLNVDDADVIRYLGLFTFLSDERIVEIAQEMESAPEKRAAQRLLADEVTALIHGEEATQEARVCAEVLFGGALADVPLKSLEDIFSEVPSSTFDRQNLLSLSIVDLLAATGLVKSKGEARRLASSGGAYLNNVRVSDGVRTIAEADLLGGELLVLRTGKKSYHLVRSGPA